MSKILIIIVNNGFRRYLLNLLRHLYAPSTRIIVFSNKRLTNNSHFLLEIEVVAVEK